MQVEINDFIQYLDGKKKVYGFVEELAELRSDGVPALLVKAATDFSIKDEVQEINIISNYGQEPDFDSLKLEIFNQEYVVPVFGKVTEYRGVLEQERKVIKDTFEDSKEIAKLYDCYPTYISIRHNKGKKAGSYKYNKKEEAGEITLCPEAFDKLNLQQIIFHELGHAVWDRNISNSYKAKWIRLYDKNMERTAIEDLEVKTIREDLIASGMVLSDYIKVVENPGSLKKIVDYIKDLYNLKINHIDTLIANGDDLTKYWPTSGFKLSDYNPFVSEYATKSVEEFFAESFMFYNMKMALPESVRKAIEATLKSINVDYTKI